jgi:hypothetical protein
MRILTLSALILALAGGAAQADHRHWGGGGGGGGRGPVVVRDHRWSAPARPVYERRYGGGYRGGYYGGGGGYYGGGYMRRPIYVRGPVIREHYYNYYRRPVIIAESYGPRVGYIWISGQWQWNGYEWMWQPGHYEPDPQYYGGEVGVSVGVGY